MLHDFSFRTPEELLAGLMKSGDQRGMPKASMGRMDMSLGTMGSVGSGVPMDLNDVDYDAFLANDRTLADPEVVRTEASGRVRLRLTNAASATQFWVDLGTLTGTVVTAPRLEKLRHRSISRLKVASKRTPRWRRARPMSDTA